MVKKLLLTLILIVLIFAVINTVGKAQADNTLNLDIKNAAISKENTEVQNNITGYTNNIKQFNNLKKSISTMSANATSTSEYEYSTLSDGTIEITGYNGTDTAISIPSSISGKTVTSIGEAAFYENENITSVVIPNTVTKIGEGAFTRCTKLTSITIGNKVQTIETYAFDETAITTITIPASVKTIGDYDVYYRVHAQEFGWLGWAKNGESSGTEGFGYRLEAIEIKLVKKGGSAPGNTANAFHSLPRIKYTTHIQDIGWQDEVKDGTTAGTVGKGLRLEGLKMSIENNLGGSIQYKTHVQDIG